MVYFFVHSGDGINNWDILDVPAKEADFHIEYLDPAAVSPRAMKPNAVRRDQGYWVKPETLPQKILWANGKQPLPDILPWMAVSARFRDLVEAFEPGVHQFVPVAIYKARKGEPVATYYWFIVGQRLESVDAQRSTFLWEDNTGLWVDSILDTTTWRKTPIEGAKLFFDEDKISGHHIWHEPQLPAQNARLCSNAFAKAAQDAAFTGLSITPRERG